MTFKLNDEQEQAVIAMAEYLSNEEPFFVLSGQAGVGKTTCVKSLTAHTKGRIVFTAPTNKAVSVIRSVLTDDNFIPDCCTIYSLLGLKMEPSGEVKILSAPDPTAYKISNYDLVVVDEAGMLNSQVFSYVQSAADTGIKFLFMGDAAQLPPVGESRSPIWDIQEGFELTKVMRHDNQILTLATAIREWQGQQFPRVQIAGSSDINGGVVKLNASGLQTKMLDYAKEGLFSKPGFCKALAWRNVTVNSTNKMLRQAMFHNPGVWEPGERILAASPIKDLEGNKIASTDDEGTVLSVSIEQHPLFMDMRVYRLNCAMDTNTNATFFVLHEDSMGDFKLQKEKLLATAKRRPNKKTWNDFWFFVESMHDIRYGYATTVHRSQGSTYTDTFVDVLDILRNGDRKEALQCLYVACTRSKRFLFVA